jgi:hypothetical protein
MLVVFGTGLIGVTLCVLLALIAATRLNGDRWLADAMITERITLSLIAAFATGLVCVEMHLSGSPADSPSTLEVVLLLATLGGFALLWSWFRLCEAARSDERQPRA